MLAAPVLYSKIYIRTGVPYWTIKETTGALRKMTACIFKINFIRSFEL
jgi:hypothetical protein